MTCFGDIPPSTNVPKRQMYSRFLTICNTCFLCCIEYLYKLNNAEKLLQEYHVPIITQQDVTIYSLFISANCSTCFGWYLHPSSGAHVTVSTVSGTIETVTATCRERDWM